MSIVNENGIRIVVRKQDRVKRDGIERVRDLTIIRLKAQGQSWRQIGSFLGMSHEGARKRYQAIPEEAREHYGQAMG